ncbi:Spore germination protein OS=Ureibacillus acetophenoni OX=614649 GN=SAMN05877842_10679 PE=3 SV=1 [Ureibacillus acetophenoni]
MDYVFTGKNKQPNNSNSNNNNSPNNQGEFNNSIEKDLSKNLETIKTMLGNPDDLVVRETLVGNTSSKCAIVYMNGLTNTDLVNNNILKAVQSSNIQSGNDKDQSNNNNNNNNIDNQSGNSQNNNQSNKQQSNNSQIRNNQLFSNQSINKATEISQPNSNQSLDISQNCFIFSKSIFFYF